MKDEERSVSQPPAAKPRTMRVAALISSAAIAALTSGCVMAPPGPSPIYSRLSPEQSGIPATAQPLTPGERARYEAIDRQALADQDRAIADEAAAQAWARYYTPPATAYGSYYGGGWGNGWGVGYGYPGWGWGW